MKQLSKMWCYLIFMAWIAYLLSSSLLLFIDGFFLNRVSRSERSECISCIHQKTCDSKTIFQNDQFFSKICLQPRSRVVLLVVDALKYEFLEWQTNNDKESSFHLNKIPTVNKLLQAYPKNTKLYKFIADPPTTTMQRLKALTTGTLPTFIEISSNFATESIDEDNLIEQMGKSGGVVFIGDDTWTSLFPGKFLRQFPMPSFNVWDLDTVDREVRNRIAFELKKKDWSLLIGHTLGIDHCGHRYGQDHPEMARKLREMDRLIGEIVDALDNDTVLFVVGDHGMTANGDHGGSSAEEVEAGMFVFSKLPFTIHKRQDDLNIINQIDLVPTLSAILGIPVPFSNIGTLVVECLPSATTADQSEDDLWFAAHSIWRNVIQTKNYIDAYSKDSFLFTDEKVKELDAMFDTIKNEVRHVENDNSFAVFYKNAREYLKSIRQLCTEIWVQFDARLMSKGLVTFFCILFFLYILLNGVPECQMNRIMESYFLHFVIGANITTSVIVYILYSMKIVDTFKNTIFFSTGAVSIIFLVIVIIQNWDGISTTWYNNVKRKKVNCLERGILLLMICGLFSNSYIIHEDKCLSFLLVTTIIALIYSTIKDNHFDCDDHERKMKTEKYFVNARKLRSVIIFVGFLACLSVRLSNYFWQCREEQDPEACGSLAGKPRFIGSHSAERILLAGSIILLAFYITIVRIWLSSSGNLSGISPSVTAARYCPGVIVVCIGGYWVLQKLPKDANVKLALSWQVSALPAIVYLFILLGIGVLYAKPLCLYFLPRRNDPISIYEGEDIVKKLFDRVAELFYAKPLNEKPDVPLFYGLGTVYSATFVTLSVYLMLLWALLLGNVLAPSIFMMFVTCTAVLGIVAMERFNNADNTAELMQVPSFSVLCWFLIAEYFFYATGHQATFPGINWDAAFTGTGGHFYGNFVSAILIGVHTFGCHLIMTMTLPLLTIAPFTIFVMIPKIAHLKFRINDDLKKGELVLFERNATFHNAVFSVYGKYILLHGIRTFACMLTTTIHCRHLMVWKIFAPKLIFQGLSFLISLGTVLVSVLTVQRVSHQVDDLISKVVIKIR